MEVVQRFLLILTLYCSMIVTTFGQSTSPTRELHYIGLNIQYSEDVIADLFRNSTDTLTEYGKQLIRCYSNIQNMTDIESNTHILVNATDIQVVDSITLNIFFLRDSFAAREDTFINQKSTVVDLEFYLEQNGTLALSTNAIDVFEGNCNGETWDDIYDTSASNSATATFTSFGLSIISNTQFSTLQSMAVTSTLSSLYTTTSSSYFSSLPQLESNVLSSLIPSPLVSPTSSSVLPTSTPNELTPVLIPSLHYLVFNITYQISVTEGIPDPNLDTNVNLILGAISAIYNRTIAEAVGISNTSDVFDSGLIEIRERTVTFYVVDNSTFVPAIEVKRILDIASNDDWENTIQLNDPFAQLAVINVTISCLYPYTVTSSSSQHFSIPPTGSMLTATVSATRDVTQPLIPATSIPSPIQPMTSSPSRSLSSTMILSTRPSSVFISSTLTQTVSTLPTVETSTSAVLTPFPSLSSQTPLASISTTSPISPTLTTGRDYIQIPDFDPGVGYLLLLSVSNISAQSDPLFYLNTELELINLYTIALSKNVGISDNNRKKRDVFNTTSMLAAGIIESRSQINSNTLKIVFYVSNTPHRFIPANESLETYNKLVAQEYNSILTDLSFISIEIYSEPILFQTMTAIIVGSILGCCILLLLVFLIFVILYHCLHSTNIKWSPERDLSFSNPDEVKKAQEISIWNYVSLTAIKVHPSNIQF